MPSSTNELFRPSEYEMRIQPINTGLAVGQIRKRTRNFRSVVQIVGDAFYLSYLGRGSRNS